MTAIQKTRLELERELALRTARIEGTVDRIKSSVVAPGTALGRFVKSHPYESLLGVVAIGAAVVLLLKTHSGDKDSERPERNGVPDAYADAIASAMRKAEDRGASRDEALQAAIRANPPIVFRREDRGTSGYLSQIIDRFVNTLTALAFEYASSMISDLVKGRKSGS